VLALARQGGASIKPWLAVRLFELAGEGAVVEELASNSNVQI
jgi:hypothetical protein